MPEEKPAEATEADGARYATWIHRGGERSREACLRVAASVSRLDLEVTLCDLCHLTRLVEMLTIERERFEGDARNEAAIIDSALRANGMARKAWRCSPRSERPGHDRRVSIFGARLL